MVWSGICCKGTENELFQGFTERVCKLIEMMVPSWTFWINYCNKQEKNGEPRQFVKQGGLQHTHYPTIVFLCVQGLRRQVESSSIISCFWHAGTFGSKLVILVVRGAGRSEIELHRCTEAYVSGLRFSVLLQMACSAESISARPKHLLWVLSRHWLWQLKTRLGLDCIQSWMRGMEAEWQCNCRSLAAG